MSVSRWITLCLSLAGFVAWGAERNCPTDLSDLSPIQRNAIQKADSHPRYTVKVLAKKIDGTTRYIVAFGEYHDTILVNAKSDKKEAGVGISMAQAFPFSGFETSDLSVYWGGKLLLLPKVDPLVDGQKEDLWAKAKKGNYLGDAINLVRTRKDREPVWLEKDHIPTLGENLRSLRLPINMLAYPVLGVSTLIAFSPGNHSIAEKIGYVAGGIIVADQLLFGKSSGPAVTSRNRTMVTNALKAVKKEKKEKAFLMAVGRAHVDSTLMKMRGPYFTIQEILTKEHDWEEIPIR